MRVISAKKIFKYVKSLQIQNQQEATKTEDPKETSKVPLKYFAYGFANFSYDI